MKYFDHSVLALYFILLAASIIYLLGYIEAGLVFQGIISGVFTVFFSYMLVKQFIKCVKSE